jgi:hypothetical protein
MGAKKYSMWNKYFKQKLTYTLRPVHFSVNLTIFDTVKQKAHYAFTSQVVPVFMLEVYGKYEVNLGISKLRRSKILIKMN